MANVQLNDVTAAVLTARAAAQGLSLEAYLDQMALGSANVAKPRVTADEFLRLIEEESIDGPSPKGAFSRADLYSDHN